MKHPCNNSRIRAPNRTAQFAPTRARLTAKLRSPACSGNDLGGLVSQLLALLHYEEFIVRSTLQTVFIFTVLTFACGMSPGYAQMTFTNGASMQSGGPFAPGSFATIFGQSLCPQTATGAWTAPGQLPTALGGCSLKVGGMSAMLSYASPGQINFIVPPNAAIGSANVILQNGAGVMNGSITIGPAGPGMFALTGMGMGEGAMLHGTMWTLPPFSVTTQGATTPVSIYCTGLDLSTKPAVSIGGMMADVTWWGNAPGYVGLQQININLPAGVAGAGNAPVTVTSDGIMSNVTMMTLLPTNAMMAGMPGWGSGMMVQENMPRAHELANLAFSPSSNTALVSDANDDVLRVISISSGSVLSTITLPSKSVANSVAVDAAGQHAAVTLSGQASVALIDLTKNQVEAVIGTGYYPSHAVFAGSSLLVTNGASSTVSVIDVASEVVTNTVNVGFGPSGIAVSGNTAVVANLQDGSLSVINLTDFTTSTVTLPALSRPHEVAVSAAGQAVITDPMSNQVLLFDLSTKAVQTISLSAWNLYGCGGVVTNGTLAYIANQMSSSVIVLDLSAAKVLQTFTVDPGPRSLAINAAKNQLLVLAEGTGTLDAVDLTSLAITTRIDAGGSERQGTWTMPLITSISPNSAAAGSTFTLTINGSGFQGVHDLEFHLAGNFGGGGMMGGGMGGGMMGADDSNIKVSNVQVNAAGTQITATVQIASAAPAGNRQVRLDTGWGQVMGMSFNALFSVTTQ